MKDIQKELLEIIEKLHEQNKLQTKMLEIQAKQIEEIYKEIERMKKK